MAKAQIGDTVRIHYTGRLDDGTVFDTSENRDAFRFTLGRGEVIPGFEKAVTGMEVGEKRTATIPPAEAYGERRDDLIIEVPRDRLPSDLQPEIGQRLTFHAGNRAVPVVVTELSETTITIDANHPLAGKALTFDIELVQIG